MMFTVQDDSPERDPARPRPAPWGSTGKFLESVELCVELKPSRETNVYDIKTHVVSHLFDSVCIIFLNPYTDHLREWNKKPHVSIKRSDHPVICSILLTKSCHVTLLAVTLNGGSKGITFAVIQNFPRLMKYNMRIIWTKGTKLACLHVSIQYLYLYLYLYL